MIYTYTYDLYRFIIEGSWGAGAYLYHSTGVGRVEPGPSQDSGQTIGLASLCHTEIPHHDGWSCSG